MTDITKLRARVWHSLSPTTAAVAGLTVQNLQQFIAGTFFPNETQLRQLARYLGVEGEIR
jgi:hypothetical protein